ncbi:chemotaxis protein CheB [Frateuria edaphi]|uniref:chemotaxis protein CheB n=1 Tax=Frateuria edaphi TaxID=2898793 RepID=UPI001E53DB67|nr:chemotaxis protein CheB [Frateuria edaphi]UGB44959.1 chemotaxis protein CheB [Frateuria edaphi]
MARLEAIVIGCSAGGLGALEPLLRALAPPLPLPVIVCSHSAEPGTGLLGPLLARYARLPVREARERWPAEAGTIHLAPAGYHLLIERDRCFAYSVDEPVHYSRPSIDVLFESAADAYGAGLAGVMLTGASPDGAKGLMRIRQAGGLAIVQDPAEALASAMPQAALDQAGADHCLPLARIAPLLNELAHRE